MLGEISVSGLVSSFCCYFSMKVEAFCSSLTLMTELRSIFWITGLEFEKGLFSSFAYANMAVVYKLVYDYSFWSAAYYCRLFN